MENARLLLVANWKMQLDVAQSVALASALRAEALVKVTTVLCPSFPSIVPVHEALMGADIALGAQDIFSEDRGAFTGAVSPLMIKDFCRYVILGHSERRSHFGETDAMIARKVAAAFRHQLVPILCVGETAAEKKAGQSEGVVRAQVSLALAEVKDATQELIIAYEPVWAISTHEGATPESPEDVKKMRQCIEDALRDSAPALAPHSIILYGGSVDATNVRDYVGVGLMDGALVGSASTKFDSCLALLRAMES